MPGSPSPEDLRRCIFDLPPELLALILELSGIPDILALGKTCRRAYEFVQQNQSLWKSKFLEIFDDPRLIWESLPSTAQIACKEMFLGWRQELVERLSALVALWRPNVVKTLDDPEPVVRTLLKIMRTSRRTFREGQDFERSRSEETLSRFFQQGPYDSYIIHSYIRDQHSTCLPAHARTGWPGPMTRSEAQNMYIPDWASQLHIYRGRTFLEDHSSVGVRTARGIVYDWTVTDEKRDFGPFRKDGSGEVDWKVLEAIMTLAQMHYIPMRISANGEQADFSWNIGYYAPRAFDKSADWAGIEGPWEGVYGYLNPADYAHWNTLEELGYGMDLAITNDFNGWFIGMKLVLGSFQESLEEPALQSRMPYCSDLPKLFFTGGANVGGEAAAVKGCAWLAPGACEVRWRFLLSYGDDRIDRLEGVQPAGVRTGHVYGLRRFVAENGAECMGPFFFFPDTRLRYGTLYPWGQYEDPALVYGPENKVGFWDALNQRNHILP